MSVIDSKTLHKFLGAFSFKVVSFFAALLIFIAIILELFTRNSGFFLYTSIYSSILLFILSFFNFQRTRDIKQIKGIIDDIIDGNFKNASEIVLSNSLYSLQSSIRKMYSKIELDISYLKKLEKSRSEFLGNVSHELKTPIFAIGGYIETLIEGGITDENVNMHFLNKALLHTNNLTSLLNDLIDISMIEAGEMRMNLRYFTLKGFLEEIIQDFQELADKKKITLMLSEIRPSLSVFGDKIRLRQVLNNLIQNALKYTEQGEVKISAIETKDFAEIIVSDTGIGIPEENLEHIFERFYRVDKNRSREVGGTGLGLAIVKHILDAHRTKVEVRSVINTGTEFSFRLKK